MNTATPTIYDFGNGETITVQPGSITHTIDCGPGEDDPSFNAAINGLTSLLLAQASAGVDMNTPAMHEAVQSAVDAIMNQYGDA